MQHIISTQKIHLANHHSYKTADSISVGLINKFITWCDMQQPNRLVWLSIAFVGGIGAALPVTLSAIVFVGGNDINLWIIACIINVPILVVNLALESTKITLPVLFFAWIMNVLIIVYCLFHFFMR